MKHDRALNRLIIILILTGIFIFYLWTVSSTYEPFHFGEDARYYKYQPQWELASYYNLLTDSFLAGRLDLLVDPPPEMFALADPYDPSQNAQYRRLHDVSFYKGRYYLYFGPTPALTLFLPYRLLSGGERFPGNLAAALYGFGGFVWSVLLLQFLMKKYMPDTPYWMFLVAVICLGLCNTIPFILRRPAVYEIAISGGYFFVMGGLYLLVSGGIGKELDLPRLLFASIFIGLAVGCRPNMILASPLLFVVWLKILYEKYNRTVRDSLREFAVLLVPLLAFLLFLGLYNYLRFDSWTEFGNRYQLADINIQKMRTFQRDFILPGLYFYLLQPPTINLHFPYFHLNPLYPGNLPSDYIGPEPIAGVLTTAPVVAILFIYPFVHSKTRRNNYLTLIIILSIVIPLADVFLMSFWLGSATIRYLVDFVSFLLLSAILVWFMINNVLTDKKIMRLSFNSLVVVGIIFGCCLNIAISFTGYYDLLKKGNPGLYYIIEKIF